ncbi:hypothetical protein K8I61_08015 [bacterium]|nr:hypothetical protein [bacterium]
MTRLREDLLNFLRTNPEAIYRRLDPTPEAFRLVVRHLRHEKRWLDSAIVPVLAKLADTQQPVANLTFTYDPPLPPALVDELQDLYRYSLNRQLMDRRGRYGQMRRSANKMAPANPAFCCALLNLLERASSVRVADRAICEALAADNPQLEISMMSQYLVMVNPYVYTTMNRKSEAMVRAVTHDDVTSLHPRDYFRIIPSMRNALMKLTRWLAVPERTLVDFPTFELILETFGHRKLFREAGIEFSPKAPGSNDDPQTVAIRDDWSNEPTIRTNLVEAAKKYFVDKVGVTSLLHIPRSDRSVHDFEVKSNDGNLFVLVGDRAAGETLAPLTTRQRNFVNALLPTGAVRVAYVELRANGETNVWVTSTMEE